MKTHTCELYDGVCQVCSATEDLATLLTSPTPVAPWIDTPEEIGRQAGLLIHAIKEGHGMKTERQRMQDAYETWGYFPFAE